MSTWSDPAKASADGTWNSVNLQQANFSSRYFCMVHRWCYENIKMTFGGKMVHYKGLKIIPSPLYCLICKKNPFLAFLLTGSWTVRSSCDSPQPRVLIISVTTWVRSRCYLTILQRENIEAGQKKNSHRKSLHIQVDFEFIKFPQERTSHAQLMWTVRTHPAVSLERQGESTTPLPCLRNWKQEVHKVIRGAEGWRTRGSPLMFVTREMVSTAQHPYRGKGFMLDTSLWMHDL